MRLLYTRSHVSYHIPIHNKYESSNPGILFFFYAPLGPRICAAKLSHRNFVKRCNISLGWGSPADRRYFAAFRLRSAAICAPRQRRGPDGRADGLGDPGITSRAWRASPVGGSGWSANSRCRESERAADHRCGETSVSSSS